jgi:hypothetical protein
MDIKRIHDHKIALRLNPDVLDSVEDILLKIDYTGNVGYAFSEGQLFHDHFHNGTPWEIGLWRFREYIRNGNGEIILETTPLRQGVRTVAADAVMAIEQHFAGEQAVMLHTITAEPVYRVALSAKK